jgi:hypothetical protein
MIPLGIASAESIQWTKTEKQPSGTGLAAFRLSDRTYGASNIWTTVNDYWQYSLIQNPTARIEYNVEVTDADTGAVYRCGSSTPIPVDTRLRFRFIPHESQDIYWFSTGASFDSPYGDWVNNAARPHADMCSNFASKDYVGTDTNKNNPNPAGMITGKIYYSLSVDPPTKTLAVDSQFECSGTASSLSRVCKAKTPGPTTNTFSWSATKGKYYGRTKVTQGTETTRTVENRNGTTRTVTTEAIPTGSCWTSNRAAEHVVKKDNSAWAFYFAPYDLDVPKQTFNCPIVIATPPDGNRTPTISAGNPPACTTGSPHTLSFTGSDPDGDKIKYIINWGHLGSSDTWVNGTSDIETTALMNSGSIQKTRTYSLIGSKSVLVRVEDEHGARSEWITLSFNCAQGGGSAQNNPVNDDSDAFCSDPAYANDPNCTSSGEGSFSGTGTGVGTGSGSGSGTNPDLVIRAVPSRVKPNDRTRIHWSTLNVRADSCTVTAPNGDSWTGGQSPTAEEAPTEGGEETSPIAEQTRYTLACTDLSGNRVSKVATVSLLPSFEEK